MLWWNPPPDLLPEARTAAGYPEKTGREAPHPERKAPIKQPRVKKEAPMQDEAGYICDSCGEEIVIPLDLSAGGSQQYVEDCPVCCRPNLIRVEVESDGEIRVWAQSE